MKVLLALILCAIFCGSVFGQVTRVFLIDSFTTDSPALFIITNGQQQTVSNFATSSSIVGDERDLELTALTGNNVVLSAGVADGTFNSAAPKGASGISLLQYDGTDQSIDLNPSGLNGEDFTRSGAFAMRVNITADIGTNVFFKVYSGSASNFCQFKQAIPGNSIPALYTLRYSQFTDIGSGCNFDNVGALEIEVDLQENVDITIDTIEVISNNPTPSKSRTPTRSRVPASPSNTRTPSRSRVPASPSNTRTPSRSRVPASPSNTRTPSRSRVPASPSNTRTPSRSRIPASNSPTPTRTRTPSQIPRSPSRTPSPSNCVCTCPELECYMFKLGEYTFRGNVARDVNEFQAINEEEGFDFLKFF